MSEQNLKSGLLKLIKFVETLPEDTVFNMNHYDSDVIGYLHGRKMYQSDIVKVTKDLFDVDVNPMFQFDVDNHYYRNYLTKDQKKAFNLNTDHYGLLVPKLDWLQNAREVYFDLFIDKPVFDFSKRTKYKPLNETIVSAAAKSPDGLVIMSRRHCDNLFFAVVDKIYNDKNKQYHDWVQGFVTSKGDFVTREEAWVIAEREYQIKRITGSPGILYSEDLY